LYTSSLECGKMMVAHSVASVWMLSR